MLGHHKNSQNRSSQTHETALSYFPTNHRESTFKWSRGITVEMCDFCSKLDIYWIVVFVLVFLRQSSKCPSPSQPYLFKTRGSLILTQSALKRYGIIVFIPGSSSYFWEKTDPASVLMDASIRCRRWLGNNNLTRTRSIRKYIGS